MMKLHFCYYAIIMRVIGTNCFHCLIVVKFIQCYWLDDIWGGLNIFLCDAFSFADLATVGLFFISIACSPIHINLYWCEKIGNCSRVIACVEIKLLCSLEMNFGKQRGEKVWKNRMQGLLSITFVIRCSFLRKKLLFCSTKCMFCSKNCMRKKSCWGINGKKELHAKKELKNSFIRE